MALWSFVLLKPKPVAKRREGEEAQDSHTISKAKNLKPAWRRLMLLRSTPSCELLPHPAHRVHVHVVVCAIGCVTCV